MTQVVANIARLLIEVKQKRIAKVVMDRFWRTWLQGPTRSLQRLGQPLTC